MSKADAQFVLPVKSLGDGVGLFEFHKGPRARISPKRFVQKVSLEIVSGGYHTVAIHREADFDSVRYVQAWVSIVRSLPWVRFFSHTRSWQLEKLIPALNLLRSQPNVVLWWMAGPESDDPPEGRIVWVNHDPDQEVPEHVGLVFGPPAGWHYACPQIIDQSETCAQCGHCFKDALVNNGDKP